MIDYKHPLIQISQEYSELCRPLEMLNVHHFTYHKHFFNGSRVALSNKPQWIDDYFQLALYESSSFDDDPLKHDEGFQVFIGDYPLNVYQHGRQYYDSAHSIVIVERQNDGCEFYIFAVSRKQEQSIHYLANNVDLLYHFILFLKDRAAKLLIKASENKLNFEKKTRKRNKLLNIQNADEIDAIKQKFYRETHIYQYQFEKGDFAGLKLTNREIDCISCLNNHMSAEQTAKLLGLTRRTIESYLENIKIKLCCVNKNEIINKLRICKDINALRNLLTWSLYK